MQKVVFHLEKMVFHTPSAGYSSSVTDSFPGHTREFQYHLKLQPPLRQISLLLLPLFLRKEL